MFGIGSAIARRRSRSVIAEDASGNPAAPSDGALHYLASDSSMRPVILSPREKGGVWLVALAAYTDAETAGKAVQYARQSGIGPDAYFWNVPRSGAAEEMLGGNR